MPACPAGRRAYVAAGQREPDGPNRRKFLVLAGGLALGAGAGTAIGLAATEPHGPSAGSNPGGQAGTLGPARRSSPGQTPAVVRSLASPQPADWALLRTQLSTGMLARPGGAGYRTARLQFDPRFDDARPAGVAYCATPADVGACLA